MGIRPRQSPLGHVPPALTKQVITGRGERREVCGPAPRGEPERRLGRQPQDVEQPLPRDLLHARRHETGNVALKLGSGKGIASGISHRNG